MKKEKDILIRVDEKLKKNLIERARKVGLSVSAYVRMMIVKDLCDE